MPLFVSVLMIFSDMFLSSPLLFLWKFRNQVSQGSPEKTRKSWLKSWISLHLLQKIATPKQGAQWKASFFPNIHCRFFHCKKSKYLSNGPSEIQGATPNWPPPNWFTIWMFPKIVVTPKSSILIGFSTINHPFWGTPIFGNTHLPFVATVQLSKRPLWGGDMFEEETILAPQRPETWLLRLMAINGGSKPGWKELGNP